MRYPHTCRDHHHFISSHLLENMAYSRLQQCTLQWLRGGLQRQKLGILATSRGAFSTLPPKMVIGNEGSNRSFVTRFALDLKKSPLKLTDHTFSTGRVVHTARPVDEKGWLEVVWQDGLVTQYPYVWLRDNCTCEKCYNPVSLSRKFLLLGLDPDIKPVKTKVNAQDGSVHLEWPDGHTSSYPGEWLEGRSFTQEAQTYRKAWHPPPSQLWGRDQLQGRIPKFDFQQLMEDDHALYDWICSLHTEGICLVKNAPCETGQVNRMGDRIGHLRTTNYGETFQVESKENASNLAYTPGTLGLHTDESFYQASLGMQMLHCISQVPSEGGENVFVDGFYMSYLLKEKYPEHYETLTKTIVDHRDIGDDHYKFFQYSRHPIIGLDAAGNVDHIVLNHASRDSFMDMSAEQASKFYQAIIQFTNMMYEPQNHITNKLEEGDIVCLHNFRVLHGRAAYKVLSGGKRHLEGGYIDWDELDSKRRVLSMQLDQ